jgi:hypothetical protein
MPKPPAPPLPEGCTTGQLARLLHRTERVVAGRKADGRLPVTSRGEVDLAALIRAGVDAYASAHRRGQRLTGDETNREAISFAIYAAGMCWAAGMRVKPGEDPGALAAETFNRVLADDDTWHPPLDWAPAAPFNMADYADAPADEGKAA